MGGVEGAPYYAVAWWLMACFLEEGDVGLSPQGLQLLESSNH